MRRFTKPVITDLGDARPHPILAKPGAYFVSKVAADFDRDWQQNSSLKLTLVRDAEIVCLRFDGIQQLEIDPGFPYSNGGLQILDISHLGWDSLRVRVQGFEQDPGIRFWANSVERVA